jgi:hypothetical protein
MHAAQEKPTSTAGVHVEQQTICEAVDADTNAHVTVRDDMTMIIKYETGDTVIHFADGSRLTKWADRTWILELEALPCIQGDIVGIRCYISSSSQLSWTAESRAVYLKQETGHCAVVVGHTVACGMPPPAAAVPNAEKIVHA